MVWVVEMYVGGGGGGEGGAGRGGGGGGGGGGGADHVPHISESATMIGMAQIEVGTSSSSSYVLLSVHFR